MRDILVVTVVIVAALGALRRPWVGVMLWTWLSVMNPHRYTWGWAYELPLAAIAAGATFVGLVFSSERQWPLKGGAAIALVLFMGWVTISWLFGLDPSGDYEQWAKVMKIDVMIIVALAALHSKRHIFALAWVVTGSLALLGIKGGIFTLTGGGQFHVWGPPGSFIEGNNEFGLALIMIIPMLRFLQMQEQRRWLRHTLTLAMVLCAAAALGTQSRGALVAIAAMALLLWWRGRSRFAGGLVILASATALLAFMPESWVMRMQTIETYDADASAMGRIAAWSAAWNSAFDYPFGVGFNTVNQALFDKYSTMPQLGARAAHSIYFQVLGSHGFGGLALFLLIWVLTLRSTRWLRLHGERVPQAKWCADLAAMCEVSFVGYFVGGAFLSLAYFDLPYNMLVLVVLARAWVESKAWEREAAAKGVAAPLPGALPLPTRS